MASKFQTIKQIIEFMLLPSALSVSPCPAHLLFSRFSSKKTFDEDNSYWHERTFQFARAQPGLNEWDLVWGLMGRSCLHSLNILHLPLMWMSSCSILESFAPLWYIQFDRASMIISAREQWKSNSHLRMRLKKWERLIFESCYLSWVTAFIDWTYRLRVQASLRERKGKPQPPFLLCLASSLQVINTFVCSHRAWML